MANRLHSAVGRLRRLLADPPGSQLTDQQLLQRFVATREETAFATLVDRHGPMVLGVCRSVLRHQQDAEDVFQATFLILARKAVTIRKPASLAPWLHGVAYRLSVRARAERERAQGQRGIDRSPANSLDELTGRELHQILHEEVARLPESYRLPLILCYLESQTQDEAARQLGWAVTTLKGRLSRGRNLLRRRLSRRGLSLGLPLLIASLAGGTARGALAGTTAEEVTRIALRSLAGEAMTGSVGRAVALAEGWEKAMLMLRLKVGAVLVLTVVILGAGAGLAAYQAQQRGTPTAQPGPADGKGERRDGRGDSLPEGAVLRFGSARLRHGDRIYGSALSPDGKTLATAGAHSVIVWHLDTGKALYRFHCDRGSPFCGPGLTFSPDGTRLGYVRGSFIACVWDVRTGKELRRFERRFEDGLGKFWNGNCQFANQGKELVLISREAIETWNVETGQMTASLPVAATRVFSRDGTMYIRNLGNAVILGTTATGKEVRRLEVTTRQDGIENGIALSPDGKTLALVHAQKEIQLCDVEGGKVLASFPLPDSAQKKVSGDASKYWEYRVTFSSDGRTLLLGTGSGLIHRWDVATGKEQPPLSKHHCGVTGMHTLPDGRTLVSAGEDGVIRRWDLQTGRHDVDPDSYEGRTTAAYSPDGRFAAIGDVRGRLDLWDGRTGKRDRTLQQEGAAVTHLAFSPNGKLLATAERSGTVRFWQVPSGRPGAVWPRQPVPGEWFCNGLVFSPDGRLLCLSDYPRQFRVVEVASGKLLWTGKCSYAEAFSPDGITLLVAAPTGSYLTRLEATTGKKGTTVRLNTNVPDNSGVMYTLAFSPDGRRLAVAQSGGTLMLCDGQTCTETHRLADGNLWDEERRAMTGGKPRNQVRALAFSPDGKWFASAGTDTAVYVWEAVTGKEVLCLAGHEAEVSRVAFSPDGRSVFSCGQDGQGYLWSLKPKAAGPRATLNELWTDLAETNSGKAYRAVWALSEAPRAVDFLRKTLPPAVLPDRARVAKLIAELDSTRFEVRNAADRALAELAELAAPALEEASRTPSSPEQRKRLEGLLTPLKGGLSSVQLARMRAVQALELAGRADARKALEGWARGTPAARLTQEAQAALDRLNKRKP